MVAAVVSLWACREDQMVILSETVQLQKEDLSEEEDVEEEEDGETVRYRVRRQLLGFYLLNEGNMGSNKCTLDYYDFVEGVYHRNIYGEINPEVPKELGDVGNDIGIYGSRLYAVINCSNKVEVMDARTARRIGQIDIPNCRYIRFHDKYAYVTSYAGPVLLTPDYDQIGYVAKVDTATLQVVATCEVGFQPDELEITDGKIFVANSGGYMSPNYENTVSVIDLETFTEMERIEVAVNLHHLKLDGHGQLWVSSRGDYETIPSELYYIDVESRTVMGSMDTRVSNFCINGDSLYVYSDEFSYISYEDEISYARINLKNMEVETTSFISDGTQGDITMPYGIAVNPVNKDIYVTNAGDYVNPGRLYCYSKDGVLKWSVRAGDIPAHMAFLWKETKEKIEAAEKTADEGHTEE